MMITLLLQTIFILMAILYVNYMCNECIKCYCEIESLEKDIEKLEKTILSLKSNNE